MSKTTKVLSITDSIINLVCIRVNDAVYNPYLLYLVYPAKDKYGYPVMHKKLLIKYADMDSVICHIKDLYLICRFRHKSVSEILAWNKKYCGNTRIRT